MSIQVRKKNSKSKSI